eukprot:2843524-Amphidinium_carterae.1
MPSIMRSTRRTDVNQLSYWRRFMGKTAKQILYLMELEVIAAATKLVTVTQEGRGKRRFAIPKGLRSVDIVSRETYDLDSRMLVSSEIWDATKKPEPLFP